jgi:hypothetical protein
MSEKLKQAMEELDALIDKMDENRSRERRSRSTVIDDAESDVDTKRVRFIPSHRGHEHIDMTSLP